jgi:hypothetical protein
MAVLWIATRYVQHRLAISLRGTRRRHRLLDAFGGLSVAAIAWALSGLRVGDVDRVTRRRRRTK